MTRYLAHAITRRETGGPVAGLRGLPLRWIGGVELGVWVTEWTSEPTLTRDDTFAHHDLVAVLCDAGPCLPVRFGTWLATEAAARRSLEEDRRQSSLVKNSASPAMTTISIVAARARPSSENCRPEAPSTPTATSAAST